MKKALCLLSVATLLTGIFLTSCANAAGEGSSTDISNPSVIDDNDNSGYNAPNISSYYKKYFIGSSITTNTADGWGSGTAYTLNTDDNNSLSVTASTGWSADAAACAAYNVTAGSLANYEYAVLTVDLSNFTLAATGDVVAVKIPETQVSVLNNAVTNGDGTKTFYAPISSFSASTGSGSQIAFILWGEGTAVIKEAYVAAAVDPTTVDVTSISISPTTLNLVSGDTQTFTVKDSNNVDVTSSATFAIEGTDLTGSTISANVLIAGSTAGSVTVKATYNDGTNDFTSTSTVTVLTSVTNLVTNVSETFTWVGDASWGPITDGVVLSGNLTDGYTYTIPVATDAQWKGQLMLTTDADVVTGDNYYFSVVLESDVDLAGITIKFDETNQIVIDTSTSLAANTAKKIIFQGTSAVDKDDIKFVFDFGNNPAATVKVSDLTFAKIN